MPILMSIGGVDLANEGADENPYPLIAQYEDDDDVIEPIDIIDIPGDIRECNRLVDSHDFSDHTSHCEQFLRALEELKITCQGKLVLLRLTVQHKIGAGYDRALPNACAKRAAGGSFSSTHPYLWVVIGEDALKSPIYLDDESNIIHPPTELRLL